MNKRFFKTITASSLLVGVLISGQALAQQWGADQLNGQFTSWGIANDSQTPTINLLGAWQKFKKKKEIIVAVIDTGVDATHPFLANNLYVPTGRVSAENYGVDFSKGRLNQTQPDDKHGHGTHVAGIVKSVFPDVKILVLKYFNPHASGQDNLDSTIEALRFAVDQGVDIINYSGGGPEPAVEELTILKKAERKGILIVAAAGNEESNIDDKKKAYFPASYGLTNIITVTAHDQSRTVLSSSNYGKRSVDISAPGYRIKSSLPGGRAGYLTGTSQATAFVSGVAALLKSEFPELTFAQVKTIIRESALKEGSLSDKCFSGGRLDASKAIDVAANMLGVEVSRAVAQEPLKGEAEKKEGKIYYRTK